jgi:hypothetical protein
LLVVATGNISNNDLIALFAEHLDAVVAVFGEARLAEMRPDELVIHEQA